MEHKTSVTSSPRIDGSPASDQKEIPQALKLEFGKLDGSVLVAGTSPLLMISPLDGPMTISVHEFRLILDTQFIHAYKTWSEWKGKKVHVTHKATHACGFGSVVLRGKFPAACKKMLELHAKAVQSLVSDAASQVVYEEANFGPTNPLHLGPGAVNIDGAVFE